MSGKGSRPRPFSIGQKEYADNYNRIFRKPDPRALEDAQAEDEAFKRIEQQSIMIDFNDKHD